ncbi:hypothetical protein GSI_01478 [Ganoderma sinense ZZ0214-1]|uniref:Uncharacterized protein n=1 Tax=Ganoderma sinense ZZ0214-1 TaxID=1077348 RepID=A0A2G8SQG7_9APHY|nr:hypothetical protein GSI_01478 [Ganoderma sinense ZZ0214-1]
MDSLLAIGVGLGLRALIDSVTHHNHRVNGSLVGLWEGAVLRHFITKHPSTFDPYIAYGFRLLADLLWTQSWMRLVIVVLWTFMGMLLSDVGVDLSADRRFRRLTRTLRYTIIYPLLRQFSSSRRSSSSSSAGPSHAQYYQVPGTTSTTSTARSPATQARSPTDISAPPRSATPGPRRPALRVPGSFSDRTSETDTDATRPPPISRENSSTSQRDGSVTSRSSSSRTPSVTFSDPLVSQTRPLTRADTLRRTPSNTVHPSIASVLSPPSSVGSPPATVIRPPISRVPRPILTTTPAVPTSPPVRPRSPELEYVSVPAIPEPTHPLRPVLSDDERSLRSGLTTPRSDRSRPDANLYSPPPVTSGLTTPDRSYANLPHSATPVPYGTSSASSTATGGTEATAAPLPIRIQEPEADAEQVQASLLHPGLLPDIPTPQPSPGVVQPAEYLPSPSPEDKKAPLPIRMPEPDLSATLGAGAGVGSGGVGGGGGEGNRMTMSEPPPAYEQTPGQEEMDSGSNTPAQSVLSHSGDRQRLLQRAESFRSTADEVDKRRARLKRELEEARRGRDHWAAFKLKHEVERAEKETQELHAKAARRFYQGASCVWLIGLRGRS